MIGNDLVVSAKTISDIISRPSIVANPEYAKDNERYLSEAFEVVNCESKVCQNACEQDDVQYKFYFNGEILQDF